MLILQKDYITIDLEKIGDWSQIDGTKTGPVLGLIITLQVNGKLKRSVVHIKTHWQGRGVCSTKEKYKETCKILDIENWEGIHSVVEFLNDIGYELDVMEIQTLIINALGTLPEHIINFD